MRRPLTLALLAALLTAPHAAAWPWDPITITVAESRVGDVLRHRVEARGDVAAETRTLLIRVEGTGTAHDRYGIERDVETYRIDHVHANGSLASAEICHALAGGLDAVRRDLLAGAWGWGGAWGGAYGASVVQLGQVHVQYDQQAETLYLPHVCEGRAPGGGQRFTEGDTVTPFALGLSNLQFAGDSAPAEAAEFDGRPALRFRFEMVLPPDAPEGSRGHAEVLLADGLPGVVRLHMEAVLGDRLLVRTQELEGLARGDGAPLPPFAHAALPDRNPQAAFVPLGRFELPDEGLQPAYPSREAIASLLADPRVGLKAWLDRHPDAVLASATYDRNYKAQLATETDGGWEFTWVDGEDAFSATTVRAYHGTPLGRVARPPVLEQWGGAAPRAWMEPPPAPEAGADAETLTRLLTAGRMPLERVEWFTFSVLRDTDGRSHHALQVSDGERVRGGRTDARVLMLDATEARLGMAWRTTTVTTRSSPLDPLASPTTFAPQPLTALSALAGPGVGAGLGVGAATGLALLVVAVKLVLVPLFTRLVRARLLDNPVRARLYERVRAEPGIRQAELVDYLGVGEGTARHHLAQLVRHRFVVECREDGAPSYYAAGEVPPDVARRAAVLRSASAKRVYDLYAGAPGLPLREAAARLGMSAPSVHRQKRKLEKAGLLPTAALAP